MAEGVILTEALEDDVPEGYQGSEGPLIESQLGESQPIGNERYRQEAVKTVEQLGSGEAGAQQRRRLGGEFFAWFGRGGLSGVKGAFKGVFFDCKYAYYILCIHLSAIFSFVKQKNRPSSAQWRFWKKLQSCWPALKGSLALVYKPCIRPNCRACASGKKHPNYLLAFTDKGRRRCLYVPAAMVPVLKRALSNGRRIEQLLYQMGPALVEEYRMNNPAQTGPAVAPARLVPKKRRLNS
jgi:hypothetical protein